MLTQTLIIWLGRFRWDLDVDLYFDYFDLSDGADLDVNADVDIQYLG